MKNLPSDNLDNKPEKTAPESQRPNAQMFAPPKKPVPAAEKKPASSQESRPVHRPTIQTASAASAAHTASKQPVKSAPKKDDNSSKPIQQTTRRVVSPSSGSKPDSDKLLSSRESTKAHSTSVKSHTPDPSASPKSYRGPSASSANKSDGSGFFSKISSALRRTIFSSSFYSSPQGMAFIIALLFIAIVLVAMIFPRIKCFSNEISIDDSLYLDTFVSIESETDLEKYYKQFFSKDDSNDDVMKIQYALYNLGHISDSDISGTYDDKTIAAVEDFLATHNFEDFTAYQYGTFELIILVSDCKYSLMISASDTSNVPVSESEIPTTTSNPVSDMSSTQNSSIINDTTARNTSRSSTTRYQYYPIWTTTRTTSHSTSRSASTTTSSTASQSSDEPPVPSSTPSSSSPSSEPSSEPSTPPTSESTTTTTTTTTTIITTTTTTTAAPTPPAPDPAESVVI